MTLGLERGDTGRFRRKSTRKGFENYPSWQEGYEFFGEYGYGLVQDYTTGYYHEEESLELVKGNV